MDNDPIYLSDYDSNWLHVAQEEVELLKETFRLREWVLDIQHIGSTSIQGLIAKPIIDIYIGVRSIQEAQQAIATIETLGYQYWDKNPNKEKLFFVKGMPPFGTGRTHHLHIAVYEGDSWNAVIIFRDYMRSHPEELSSYAAIKQELAQKYRHNREAYTNAKTEYITTILKKAGFEF